MRISFGVTLHSCDHVPEAAANGKRVKTQLLANVCLLRVLNPQLSGPKELEPTHRDLLLRKRRVRFRHRHQPLGHPRRRCHATHPK